MSAGSGWWPVASDWIYKLEPGDPVRIDGHRGLWRFEQLHQVLTRNLLYVLVTGPFTRCRNPRMPIQRIFEADSLRRAPRRANRNDVSLDVRLRDMSAKAKAHRRV